jgi:dTDP-4-dehydrorhamnose 3,5-epimerase
MFELKRTQLTGCFELQPKVFDDARGRFVKVFHTQAFAAHGLETNFAEEYYSVSNNNVVRGMHFQLPPMDHVKVVYCVQGAVLDVVTDLRVGSPTYGRSAVIELSSAKANSIYIPKGMAHGFCSLSDQSIMVYKVSSVYAPEQDAGILWNSVGVAWPTTQAILSARDQTFTPFDKFVSPFRYE